MSDRLEFEYKGKHHKLCLEIFDRGYRYLEELIRGLLKELEDKNEELSRTNNAFDAFKSQHTTLQRDNSNLQSALDAEKGTVVGPNQRLTTHQSDLQTTQRSNSNLQSALDAQKEAVIKANQTISNLQSDLATTQSALDALKREAAEDKLKLSLGIGDFKQWMRQNSVNADSLIPDPDPSTSLSDIHHVFAHNALVNVRSKDLSSAYANARKSIDARPSAIGYIVKALAQIGMGEPEKMVQVFDLAFVNCNPEESNLLLLIKTIVLFVARKCDTAISRVRDLIAASRDNETKYCCFQVLANMYHLQGDYVRAVQSLEEGQGLAPSCIGSDLEIISLIFGFGWTFDELPITAQRRHCESLYSSGRVEEAKEALLKILDTFGEEIHARNWVMDLKRKLIDKLESLGDMALSSGEHDNAIGRYTSALCLDPSNPIDILVKRSKARASIELWEDALMDANEVIERDPSSHRGYERKYAALHGLENYGEATNAYFRMLSIIENSQEEEVRRLRANCSSPSETIAAINAAIPGISGLCPRVLIDVEDGRLCDEQERIQMFKSGIPFKKIVSETAMTKIDPAQIRQSVAKYFKWIMFSHTWEGREPTLKDVNLVHSVWELDGSPLNEKLRQFCRTARDDGYRWAWSDTCCIDKDTSATSNQSLVSMYSWYEKAAGTLVYLADVPPSSEPGDLALTNSRWMTRAWTLQELLASKVIRFYNRDWKLYLNDKHPNHKESPEIKQELAKAMGVAPETIRSFQPKDLGVREKLRLASTRNATVEEDIAYSLLGIFSSDIIPQYGLGKTTLGQLLENIVDRTGDVTVISWTGQALPYNSALPDSLRVYSQGPYTPPPMEVNELDACVEQLHAQLVPQDALAFYYRVIRLPRATFRNRCLKLPCIMFTVSKIDKIQGNLYRATVSSLGEVEFRTTDVMPRKQPRRLVFVYPWIPDLRELLDGSVSDDEAEAEAKSDIGSSDGPESKSDAGSGDGTDDASERVSPSDVNPSAGVDPPILLALRLIARLGRSFNALLLKEQSNKQQYKRVAAEHEIIVPGVPYKTNHSNILVGELEVV